jgi:MFS family permease
VRLPALAHRDFRNYQVGNFISNVGNRMQSFALILHVFERTHSNAYVGALGLVRVLPLIVFGLFGGVLADHFDRRGVIFVTQIGMLLVAVALGLARIYGFDHLWVLYLLVAASAVANAFNGPARQAMIANLVPAKDFTNAASINGITWRLSDILGPMFAGLLVASGRFDGLAAAYILNAASFIAVLYVVWLLPRRPPTSTERARSVADTVEAIKGGFAFFRQAHVVRNTMLVDFWATFFAGAEALLPAFAHDVLGLAGTAADSAAGLLASATGVGALLGSLTTALLPTIQRQGLWVLRMIALFGLVTIGFGLSVNLPMAFVFLAAVGAADMVSTVLRQTIRQLSTPDHMRGRLGSIGMMFQVSGPQLGDAEAGYAADGLHLLGMASMQAVRTSIIIGGLGSLFVAGWWMRGSPLTRYDRHVEAEE